MMLLRLAFFFVCLITRSFCTPAYMGGHHPKYIDRISRSFMSKRSPSPPSLDKNTALTAQVATLRKFQNAPSLLAGQGTSPGYTIPPSLQDPYDRASDHATNISFLRSQPNSLANASPYITSAFGVAGARMFMTAANYSATDPLTDETDGTDDYEYYGPMTFGSQGQALLIDFDSGSADLWVASDACTACGSLSQFQTTSSSTYHNTAEPFSVTYGLGFVGGTLARDTVAIGQLVAPNQTFGVVNVVSLNFGESPSDGLAGLAFSTIAKSRQPTFFENIIPQLEAPLFSVYMTRTEVHGSEIRFGGIDASKTIEEAVIWVPVVSKTWWTVGMSGLQVNTTLVRTEFLMAIIDTGTSYIYVPSAVASSVYAQIPGSAPAPDYGSGYYTYQCDPPVEVSWMLGSATLAMDSRDMNLGRYEADPTGRTCVGAIVGSDQFEFAILGVSFLKKYITIFDYSHGGRVGFAKSITSQ